MITGIIVFSTFAFFFWWHIYLDNWKGIFMACVPDSEDDVKMLNASLGPLISSRRRWTAHQAAAAGAQECGWAQDDDSLVETFWYKYLHMSQVPCPLWDSQDGGSGVTQSRDPGQDSAHPEELLLSSF